MHANKQDISVQIGKVKFVFDDIFSHPNAVEYVWDGVHPSHAHPMALGMEAHAPKRKKQ